ncbi:MAG: hypothetical protein HZA16_08965 [Nitrospirae bacterium]|nr:hypothetical protein [Nitrospirota bacterium]
MIKPVRKILFFDRPVSILSLLAVAAVISAAVISSYAGKITKSNITLKSQLAELQSLSRELVGTKALVESKEKKIGLTRTGGVVPVLEQTLQSLGMKARVIKPLRTNKVKEYTEEDAELEIQDADLNSIVNLLYKIDNSPAPMKIKNASVRAGFEDPDKFVLKLTVSLISKG